MCHCAYREKFKNGKNGGARAIKLMYILIGNFKHAGLLYSSDTELVVNYGTDRFTI